MITSLFPDGALDLQPAPARPTSGLAQGEIHLWIHRLDEAMPARAVMARGRQLLMQLLRLYAQDCAIPPIESGEHGKPHIAVPGFPHFNLSHAGRCIVLALSRDQELGVDVEALTPRRRHSPLELAQRFFADDEARALAALDANVRDDAFLYLWTCKEAVLKAIGHGLSFGLDRLQFQLDGEGVPRALHSIAAEAGTPGEWQIRRFVPAPGHTASLAWRGPACVVRCFLVELDSG